MLLWALLLLDNEFIQYWLKLSSPEKESLLMIARNFVELKEDTSFEQYNKEMDEAMKQMDKGEFISHDEIVKISKSWLNAR